MNGTHIRKVKTTYTRAYADPITLTQGEQVQVTKSELWDDVHLWLWCINGAQKEGWVPATYLDYSDATGTARRDYSAWELTAQAGEAVTVLEEESGWAWCRNDQNEHGWIPLSCLQDQQP